MQASLEEFLTGRTVSVYSYILKICLHLVVSPRIDCAYLEIYSSTEPLSHNFKHTTHVALFKVLSFQFCACLDFLADNMRS